MNTLSITAERLFDGAGAASLMHPILQVAGDRVQSIDRGAVPPGASGERLDFPGCTIIPGMIDTHVHLNLSALATNDDIIDLFTRESDQELLVRSLANAQAGLRAGITTMRDCGGKGRIIQAVRDRIRKGEAAGPDILACGSPITTRTGHCHWMGLVADTRDEVRRAAEQMLAEDADYLKVMATGGNMTRSSNPMKAQYDPETLKLIADLGRKAGKHTAAHVLSQAGLPGAIAARVRTIEHCDWRVEEWRYAFNPTLAQQLIDQEQFVGLTLSGVARRAFLTHIDLSDYPPAQRLNARFACERQMIEHGVRYTIHSDAGVRLTPIDRFALGLRAAVIELRLTPAEVLVAVTSTAAEAIGLNDRGILKPGKRADVVVVEGNPFEDLACLERVRAVMKAGVWVVR